MYFKVIASSSNFFLFESKDLTTIISGIAKECFDMVFVSELVMDIYGRRSFNFFNSHLIAYKFSGFNIISIWDLVA